MSAGVFLHFVVPELKSSHPAHSRPKSPATIWYLASCPTCAFQLVGPPITGTEGMTGMLMLLVVPLLICPVAVKAPHPCGVPLITPVVLL